MTNTQLPFSAEPYTYSYATEPAYFYVYDSENRCSIGGHYATRESAQAEAERRNDALAANAAVGIPWCGECADWHHPCEGHSQP